MNDEQLMLFGITMLLLAIGLIIVTLNMNKRNKNSQFKVRSKQANQHVNRAYLIIYKILSKALLTKQSVYNIRSRIEMIGHINERTIRKKVVQIYLIILFIMLILLSAIMMITKQILLIGLLFIVMWFISETIVDYFVTRLKNKLLFQQIKFNDIIRHKYYESKMVDEAIYEACQSLDKNYYEIGIQGERIVDILTAKDIEKEMMLYNDAAPNKFLKLLVGLAYITMEYGDTEVNGNSVFMKNINDLTSEIRIELDKREKLNYALKSLNFIVLVPLFSITPIKNWASLNFLPLKTFYESQTGFILEMATITMIFISYILLRKIQQFDEQKLSAYRKKSYEQKLYEKGLYHIIDYIKPRKQNGNYYRLKRQLKITSSRLTVESFTVRKLMGFIIGLVSALIIITTLHHNTKVGVLTSPTVPEFFLGGQLSEEEALRAIETTESDTLYLSQITKETGKDQIIALLEAEGLEIEATKIMAERIMTKQVIFFNQYLKWWEVLLCFVAGVVGYQVPVMFLKFQRKITKIDIEDEVTGFNTIILMLMNHERLSVIEILEWLELFSITFKEAIQECLNNCSAGLTEALEVLREESEDERFIKIMDNLILASKDITIRQAFDELESEKSFYLEERKESNMRIVEKKINLGRMIGFLPVYGLIIVYMIIPMITTSMQDMNMYFEQLQF